MSTRKIHIISNIKGVAKFIGGNQAASAVSSASSPSAVTAFRQHVKDFWIPVLKNNAAKAGTNIVAVQYRMLGYWRRMRNVAYASILAPGAYEGFRFMQRYQEIRSNVTTTYIDHGMRLKEFLVKYVVLSDGWHILLYNALLLTIILIAFYAIIRFLIWIWKFIKFQRTVIHSLVAIANDEVIHNYRQDEADQAVRDLLKIVENPIFQDYITKLVTNLIIVHDGSATAKDIGESIEISLGSKRFKKTFDDYMDEYISKPITIKKLDSVLALQPNINKAIHSYTDIAIKSIRSNPIIKSK